MVARAGEARLMKLERKRSFAGTVHHVDGQRVIASRGSALYESGDGGGTFRRIARLPLPAVSRIRGATRLLRRLFRAGVYHVAPLRSGRLVVLGYRSVFLVDPRSGAAERVAGLMGSRPLALCVTGDRLYYGEYRANPERTPVVVWSSDDEGRSWAGAHTFSGVRHVHGVYHDPYTDAVWVTTGDDDPESAIWRTTDGFATLERVVSGSQQCRAIRLLFTPGSIFFGSDTPRERNHIHRLDRATGKVERMQEVEGSVFHGCAVGPRLYFSTAWEPSDVNRDRSAVVWGRDGAGSWRQLLAARKDGWPPTLFQYGQILFPEGPGEPGHLWTTPFAAAGDQRSTKWRVTGDVPEATGA
jgi:hypothetical protein